MTQRDHIVIVDDDAEIRKLLEDYLDRNGYDASSAAGGRELTRVLERRRADLIVLDFMMPGEDGFDICRRVRAESNVPIIMLTARSEDTDKIVGLELGADDYLAKPFNPRELLARIKGVLRRDFDAAGERIRTDLDESPPCTGRPLALKRCPSNLIDNALKYGKHLAITMRRDGERRVIEFHDDGPGLPEHLLEGPFEPFYRAEPSRSRETGGSGLGLAIARSIARAHGGDVTLRNDPPNGLVATLILLDMQGFDRDPRFDRMSDAGRR